MRDNDGAYGHVFSRRVTAMGIRDRPISPASPWQNGHMERLIGTVRRECLDRVLIFGEAHLRRILALACIIMNRARTCRCTRMLRSVERSNDTERLSLRPFCLGCIIATRGYDFRKGQGLVRDSIADIESFRPASIGWPASIGIGGQLASESVAALRRITHDDGPAAHWPSRLKTSGGDFAAGL